MTTTETAPDELAKQLESLSPKYRQLVTNVLKKYGPALERRARDAALRDAAEVLDCTTTKPSTERGIDLAAALIRALRSREARQ